jgi:hypothetical protein
MLKRVYLAPDELTAITLREMLKSVHITAVIQRFETTWLDGLPRVMKGGWGEVLVDERDAQDAEQHIQTFMEESERS